MSSREKILAAIKKNQPQHVSLPAAIVPRDQPQDNVQQFTTMLERIGGVVIAVSNLQEIGTYLQTKFPNKRWISLVPEIGNNTGIPADGSDPHLLEDVSLSILKGHFGVAENGAVWLTDDLMGDRALPFICGHLVLVIHRNDIIATMHDAYARIQSTTYNFATFIAGPSKTADIEQSLVLGAHGPKSLTLFLLPARTTSPC